jgi:hypothetical protein
VLGNGKWPFDFAQGKRVLSGEWREKSLERGRYWRYVVHVTGETTGYENTRRVAGEWRDQTRTLSATLVKDYRIRYCLSNGKLKAVD